MDPGTLAAAGLARSAIGAIFGGDATSSAVLRGSNSTLFDSSGGGVSTGGADIAPAWMPWALAGVGVVAIVVIMRA